MNTSANDPKRLALVAGILLIVVGMLAIGMPLLTTLAIELMLGWFLIAGGILQCISAFHSRNAGSIGMHLVVGVLYVVIGFMMVFNPAKGVALITIILAAGFLIQAAAKIYTALHIRPKSGWLWVFFNGLISAVLGIVIAAQWPSNSLWIIGMLFGLNMLFAGWALTMMAIAVKPVQ